MPTRVSISNRIISHIGVAVVVLRIVRVWYNAVRLGESVNIRVVPASVIEHETEVGGV